MLEEYVYKGAERLRCGYTTGSCAAGAAKAAAEMLMNGKIVDSVKIMTPKGILLHLDVSSPVLGEDFASCGIVKDGGDDPDVTDGICIFAKVFLTNGGIQIIGGKGIGVVTKPGLDQPVGEAAINSVPRKMITEAVEEVAEACGYSGGFRVIISAPGGTDIAKKTYNPRMGIEDGISIIGTSGIVEPMSSSAIVETIRTEAKMRRASGRKNLLLTIGNYSESFVEENLCFPVESSVKCSNFIGEAIDIGLELGFESILIVGHVGKIVKLGAGIMNTHSAFADGRMDVLTVCGLLAGADSETLKKVTGCVTVDATLDIFEQSGCLEKVTTILSEKIDYYLRAKVKNELKIGALAFSYKHGILVKTPLVDALIKSVSEEENG